MYLARSVVHSLQCALGPICHGGEFQLRHLLNLTISPPICGNNVRQIRCLATGEHNDREAHRSYLSNRLR